jgi:hypothetical protein
MRFFDTHQCVDYCRQRNIALNDNEPKRNDIEGFRGVKVSIADFPARKGYWLSSWLTESLGPSDEILLWITAWGVWPSSDNWHLYYNMRQHHGDKSLIKEAPGHYFLRYEKPALTTFVQIALVSGWDFHLLATPQWFGSFVSHDEYAWLYSKDTSFSKFIEKIENTDLEVVSE